MFSWWPAARVSAAAQTDKTPPASSTPEEVVTRYLEALKAGNFAAAYDEISKEMAQHKDRDAWAKEQQWTMQMSDAKIFSYKIYPGKVEGNLAHVPNVFSSQDKFLNQLGVRRTRAVYLGPGRRPLEDRSAGALGQG